MPFSRHFLWLALLASPALAAAPMKLIFTKGETLKYKVSVVSTESTSLKGETAEIRVQGSHLMTIKVSAVSGGLATMSVGYSGATASATALSLPPDAKKDKAKIEQAAANALKTALSTGARSQKVKSTGSATYSIKAGEGQTLSIEGGAFMMLVLPTTEPALNKPWKVNIRQPIPGAPALPCTFKWVGNVTKNGKALRKIMVHMTQSKSNKQGDVTVSMSETATGYVLFDAGRGKIMEGVIDRSAKQTAKHATQGTRTQTQSSKQTFVKV